MALYQLLLPAARFHQVIHPALAASWQRRTFAPCRELAASLLPVARTFAERYHMGAEEPLLAAVADGLPFDRHLWRALAGEVLWYAADEIPELQTAPRTLCCLLAPDHLDDESTSRGKSAPIQQAHFGSRDLVFGGGFYRPEHAGWNDVADVGRLADYLAGVDPRRWTAADLLPLSELTDDEERAEELELAREWLPALGDLYRRARQEQQMVICEIL